MFDCVLPSRNARHGMLYTRQGIINSKNAKWKKRSLPHRRSPRSRPH